MRLYRWWVVLPVAAVAAGLVVGCLAMPFNRSLPAPVAAAFDKPDEVVLYSLEPAAAKAAGSTTPPDPTKETFHGHAVLGKTMIADTTVRRKLFTAFRRGVSDHDGSIAACFIPHHGLSIRSGTRTVDLVICFKCAQVQVFDNGKPTDTVLISTSPRETFNEVLRGAGVPLSEGAK